MWGNVETDATAFLGRQPGASRFQTQQQLHKQQQQQQQFLQQQQHQQQQQRQQQPQELEWSVDQQVRVS
jgi:hypothetical protein